MKLYTPLFLATLGLGILSASAVLAQQTIGGSTAPGSTLDVRGSVSASYRQVVASSYTMTGTDYYVAFNGTAASTITLPAAGSGSGTLAANFKGRLYTVKNMTAAQTLTVKPAGSETIDGNATLSVPAGQSVQLVSTGATSGVTWDVVAFSAATTAGAGTASNGLTKAGNDVQLGGTLSRATNVNLDSYNLSFNATGMNTGNIGIGTSNPRTELHLVNAMSTSGLATTFLDPGLALSGPVDAGSFSGPGLYFEGINNPSGERVMKINETSNGTHGFLNFQAVSDDAGTSGAAVLSLQNNGNVGIGTTTPGAILEVDNNIVYGTPPPTNTPLVSFINSVASTDGIALRLNSSATPGDGFTYVDFVDGGNGQVGSIKRLAGGVAYNTTSDIRLKDDIVSTRMGLAEVLKIRVADYTYKTDKTRTLQTGFLAQQLYTVFPAAVSVGGADEETNPWQVDYAKLTPLLTKAIQEQQAEIEALKAANARLQAQASGTTTKVTSLEASLQTLAEQVKQLQAGGATAASK